MTKVPIERVQEVVRGMIGISYQHFGRDPKKGLDCLGMVKVFFKELGVLVYDPVGYYDEKEPKVQDFIQPNVDREFQKVTNFFPASLVTMQTPDSWYPNHLAIVIDNEYLLDVDKRIGVYKMRIFAVRSLIVGCYRHRKLEILDGCKSYRAVHPLRV